MPLGDPTLTAEVHESGRFVVLNLTCTGMNRYTIYRITPVGIVSVRGLLSVTTTQSSIEGGDYEAPQNRQLKYFARVFDGNNNSKSTSTVIPAGQVDYGGDYVFDLRFPLSGMQVTVGEIMEYNYGARRESVVVVGRRDPVVVTRSRSTPSGTMKLYTFNDTERRSLAKIVGTGNVVAFSPYDQRYGYDDIVYLALGDVTETRVSRLGRIAIRQWDIAFDTVSAPPGDFVPPSDIIWSDVSTTFDYWDAVTNAAYTWESLRQPEEA